MTYPFNIPNYMELPEKVRVWLQNEWNRQESGARGPGRPPKYPWDEWMDQKIHTALAGRDFHLSTDNFRSALRQKAYHAGMTVWSEPYQLAENGPTGPVQFWVTFQFLPKEPKSPSGPEDR